MADPDDAPSGHIFEPERHTNIFGLTLVKAEQRLLLAFGKHHYDRRRLGLIGFAHPGAAMKLHLVFRDLGITTLPGLAKHIREIGNYRGIGLVCYALALAILDEHGYDIDRVHNAETTYITIKAKARRHMKVSKRRPRRAGPPSDAKDLTT